MDDNDKTLKDYSIKDGDFLVVMVTKVRKYVTMQAKPAPKAPSTEDQKQQEAPAASQSQAQSQAQPTTTQSVPAQSQPQPAPSQTAPAGVAEGAIQELMSISGRSRDECA